MITRLCIIMFSIITIWVCSGCTQAPYLSLEEINQKKQVIEQPKDEEEKQYQFSGPWDKELYDSLYARAAQINIPNIGALKGSIVPHHLVGGYIDAVVFEYLAAQKPSVIVLIGPNHFGRGFGAPIISSVRDWKTPYGDVDAAEEEITLLKKQGALVINEDVIKEEHSIYSVVPFIARSLPNTSILPLVMQHNVSADQMNSFVAEITKVLPEDAVIISSIDFSHYQTYTAASFHDEFSRHVIKTFDYERINTLEIDSVPSLYVLLKLMEYYKTQQVGYELYDNSANVIGNLEALNNTSYYAPYFIAGEKQTGQAVSMLHFGDLMLDRSVKEQIEKNAGIGYILDDLAGEEYRFFRGMDIVAANAEGPFANYKRDTTKEIAFQFDPMFLSPLREYGFNLFTTANNHSLDMGRDGLKESSTNIKNAGIDAYGGDGYTVTDESLFIKNVHGIRIAFIGVNDTFHTMDAQNVQELIKKAKAESSFVIVNIHWGQEYREKSNDRQQQLAHNFIDAGTDAVIGHHPHVVQEMEIYKNKPIFYSLGNFIFDQYWSVETQKGLAVGIIVYDDKPSSLYLFPLQGIKSKVIQMRGEEKTRFLANFIDKSQISPYTFYQGMLSIPMAE